MGTQPIQDSENQGMSKAKMAITFQETVLPTMTMPFCTIHQAFLHFPPTQDLWEQSNPESPKTEGGEQATSPC
jgi:hypothetical protein